MIPSALKPRFTVRAMLVLMALFALFFWYHINWIEQRRASLARENIKSFRNMPDEEQPSAPGMLWLFGESGYGNIAIENRDDSVDVERLQSLFPESGVMVFSTSDYVPQVLKPKLKR